MQMSYEYSVNDVEDLYTRVIEHLILYLIWFPLFIMILNSLLPDLQTEFSNSESVDALFLLTNYVQYIIEGSLFLFQFCRYIVERLCSS